MAQPAKKRKFLSLEDKARIIAQAEAGKKALIAEEFGIAASSLSTILKSKDAIGKALASGTSAKHKKVTQPVHEALDKAVYTWFVETRAKKIALSGDIVRQKALDFACMLGIDDFKASVVQCAETSDSAIEAYDGDADRDEDRLLDQDEEIAVAWADLQESDVPADVHISEFLQADSCLVVREEMTDADIIKSVQEDGVSSDDDDKIAQRDLALPPTSQVQLSLGSSPPTTLSGSGTTAGSQLGSPTSLPEAFTAPSSGGEGSSGGSPSDGGSGGSAALPQLSTKCSLCHDTFTIPKVLNCLHTFCQPCLEKECTGDKVRCPQCNHDTPLPPGGTAGLPSDYAVSNILETAALEGASLGCTGCKEAQSLNIRLNGPLIKNRAKQHAFGLAIEFEGKESSAVARCFDCANFLCPNCVMAHQFMHCFEGHRVLTLGELQSARDGLRAPQDKPVACLRHRSEALRYFCRSCDTPVCKECALLDHPKPALVLLKAATHQVIASAVAQLLGNFHVALGWFWVIPSLHLSKRALSLSRLNTGSNASVTKSGRLSLCGGGFSVFARAL
ncbi:hypothetical protein HPB51_026210 [Rhipicephalus microplus]|uniref:Uncharacterized protein n=1 Tax=Rhipicephalus microplus TaxID=6941 RepID=A0A9J6DX94_RHIMP|nr:hypothetical protein HPB51_026210 [Rhipicephalus microplus]